MREIRRNGATHPNAQEFGWENMKSPRKIITLLTLVSALLAAILAAPLSSPAQDPPSAPAPKVTPDIPTQAPVKTQDTHIPASQQNPTDSQTTLKFNVSYVFLPVTVKDSGGRLVADLT